MRNSPTALVCTVRESVKVRAEAITDASRTRAPEGSTTVPTSAPSGDWPLAKVPKRIRSARRYFLVMQCRRLSALKDCRVSPVLLLQIGFTTANRRTIAGSSRQLAICDTKGNTHHGDSPQRACSTETQRPKFFVSFVVQGLRPAQAHENRFFDLVVEGFTNCRLLISNLPARAPSPPQAAFL